MNTYVGQRLGSYRLLRLLGQGGFADVYLAEHIHLGTQAALKILHIQLIDDVVQQFKREAQLIATLKPPSFRDPTDQTYTAQGQATESFNIGPGQSLDLVALFPFEPRHGVTYTFHVETNTFYTLGGLSRNSWQDEQFTF